MGFDEDLSAGMKLVPFDVDRPCVGEVAAPAARLGSHGDPGRGVRGGGDPDPLPLCVHGDRGDGEVPKPVMRCSPWRCGEACTDRDAGVDAVLEANCEPPSGGRVGIAMTAAGMCATGDCDLHAPRGGEAAPDRDAGVRHAPLLAARDEAGEEVPPRFCRDHVGSARVGFLDISDSHQPGA
mmetsp:Transcript_63405/g.163141  ORF Transcript_63405/g.163141 Transcript_63405/m.163141 type:complete len:181 (-) Transcript_63405:56-598(-)